MPINVRISTSTYQINQTRVEKMVTASSEAEAIAMGLWDSFKDLFRGGSKQAALKLIYETIKSDQEQEIDKRMEQFLNLKRYASGDAASCFSFQREDGHPPNSIAPCTSFSYVISDTVIRTEKLADHQHMQAATDMIRTYTSLSTLEEVRSGDKLGGGVYGVAYMHKTPRQTWVYKTKNANTLRGQPKTVAPMWNDVFSKLYGGRFQYLCKAEAVELSDKTIVLKTPFVAGEHPIQNDYRQLLQDALAEIGYYMYDFNKDNIVMVDGLPLPIDFDLVELN
ncbi:MAG: hypothetical protein AAF936_08820 [Pseudomonadota bacterium]